MSALLLQDWPAILDAGTAVAGGKACTLARLARYGFNVPAGMAIPVAAYRAWMAAGGLEPALLAASRHPANEQAGALAQTAARLMNVPPPAALVQALRAQLATPAWQDRALAVRSSAPLEDAVGTSFAGIHRSCLNVRGETELLHAVLQVWASLWTPAATAYRQRMGIAHEQMAMAVLIMPLVPARASGIGFNCDPLNGRDDRLLIHANWGLGESLVGGQAAGDEITLAEDLSDDSLRLLAYRTGSKAVATLPASAGGTVDAAAPPAQAGARVFDDAQALALGEQLRLAAQALDYANPTFDCEWAWDGERHWLLQARPVTVRGRCVYPELQGQPDIWSRGNTRDVVPEPLSPVDWGSARRMVNQLLETGYRLSGFPLLPGAQRAGLFHGRLYLNLSLMQWEGYAAFGVDPADMNRLVGGHQPEIAVATMPARLRLRRTLGMGRYMLRNGGMRRRGERAVVEALAEARRWLSAPLPQDDATFAAELRRQMCRTRGQHPLHFMQGSGGASLSVLVDLLEAQLPGEGHALASALLAGGPPSVTAQQSYQLAAVARVAQADPDARAWLTLPRAQRGDWRRLAADNPFRRAFAAFLDQYGHRGIYETYFRNPRWREQPEYLLDLLPSLAAIDMDAMAARQRSAASAAYQRMRAALPWWKRPLAAMLLKSAKSESNGREAARSALMAYAEPGRRLLLALGERWSARGWLATPDDIFLLMATEMLAVLDGVRPGAALAALTRDRRAQFDGWQAQTAPDVILTGPEGGAAMSAAAETPASAAPAYNGKAPRAGDVLRGVAVGSGVAVGAACVLHSPEQGDKLAPGAILVVPSTDPSWTPLFLKAGGLVMETGGFLSHGAIVAREFGIPAVVNLPGILDQLADGDMLQVDGGAGTVTRLRQA